MNDYDSNLAQRKSAERAALADEAIRQKATAHHLHQFRDRFPQQVEHCVRLVAERLQLGLRKDVGDLNNTEVRELTEALCNLYDIWVDLNDS